MESHTRHGPAPVERCRCTSRTATTSLICVCLCTALAFFGFSATYTFDQEYSCRLRLLLFRPCLGTRTDGCGIRLGNVHSRGTARHMHRLNDTSGVPNKQLRRGKKNPVGKESPPSYCRPLQTETPCGLCLASARLRLTQRRSGFALHSFRVSPACDLWSIGCLIFKLLSKHSPFENTLQTKLGQYALRDKRWDAVSGLAKDLIHKLLVVDVNQRLTAQQALAHPWFQQHTPVQQLRTRNQKAKEVANQRSQASKRLRRRGDSVRSLVSLSPSSSGKLDSLVDVPDLCVDVVKQEVTTEFVGENSAPSAFEEVAESCFDRMQADALSEVVQRSATTSAHVESAEHLADTILSQMQADALGEVI